MLSLLSAAVFAALIIFLLFFVLSVRKFMAAVVTADVATRVGDPEEIADYDALRAEGEALVELGFVYLGLLRSEPEVEGPEYEDAFTTRQLVYRHADGAVFALVGPPQNPTAEVRRRVSFFSVGRSGTLLQTAAFDAFQIDEGLPAHVVVEASTFDPAAQLECHRAALADRPGFDPRDLSIEQIAMGLRQLHLNILRHGVRVGYFRRVRGGVRMRFGWATNRIFQAVQGEWRRTAAIARLADEVTGDGSGEQAAETTAAGDHVTAQVAHFRKRERADAEKKMPWTTKLMWFATSLVLFGMAFGALMSPELVLILIVVLFLHELGHAAAMWAFGYRKLQILFVPFLGAVAVGTKRNVKAWQEIAVMLAGPVPGIVIGGLLWGAAWHVGQDGLAWVDQLAWMMIVINALNLLPIMPLDGGRVMAIVLFARVPRLQVVFAALSAVSMGLAGAMSGDVVLRTLSIVLLVGIPAQYKIASIYGAVRKRVEPDAVDAEEVSDDVVAEVYREMDAPRYAKWNGETRYEHAKQVLDRLGRPPARWPVAIGGAFVYALCLSLSIGIVAVRPALDMQAEWEAAEREELAALEARIESASTDLERAEAWVHASRTHFEWARAEESAAALVEAFAILETVDAPAIEARALLQSALLGQHPDGLELSNAERDRRLERAERLLVEAEGETAWDLVSVLSFSREEDPSSATVERHRRRAVVLEAHLDRDEVTLWRLHSAHLDAAGTLEDLGRIAEAEVEYARAEAVSKREPDGFSRLGMQLDRSVRVADLYLASGRTAEAEAILERRVALESDPLYEEMRYESDLAKTVGTDRAWAAYWQDDFDGALAHLDALPVQEREWNPDAIAIDRAIVLVRRGEADAAVELLRGIRDRTEIPLEAKSDADEYVRMFFYGPGPETKEHARREAEAERLLGPLLVRL